MRSLVTLMALGAIHAVPACTQPPETPEPAQAVMPSDAVDVVVLAELQHSGFEEPTELVIRDPAAFDRFWRRLHQQSLQQSASGPPPAPAVDFGRHTVVVVGLGPRSSGGHSVEVTRTRGAGDAAVVLYTATAPGPNCMTTQALTSPLQVVRVRALPPDVRFEQQRRTADC